MDYKSFTVNTLNKFKGLKMLTPEKIEHIRELESTLKQCLDFDETNSFDIAKMLNKEDVINILKDRLFKVYAWRLYDTYLYPIYAYLEYTNNYLTMQKFALDYGFEGSFASSLITEGKNRLDQLNKG